MAVVNKHTHVPNEKTVYIGRGSKWGNPFPMRDESQRAHVCELHRQHLNQQIIDGVITREEVAALHGKDLMCFCAPKQCHGDYLAQVAADAYAEIQQEQESSTMAEFKLIVAGGRDFNDYDRMSADLFDLAENELGAEQVSIVSGMARGADSLAVEFADREKVKLHEFPAQWDTYGRSAGYRRNADMAAASHGLLAYWDGKSRGTKHMIDIARSRGLRVWVKEY